MNTIEYHCVKYRPSQFWPLVRALQKDGLTVRIECYGIKMKYPITVYIGSATVKTRYMWSVSPFLALGKLVEEIKKQEAAK